MLSLIERNALRLWLIENVVLACMMGDHGGCQGGIHPPIGDGLDLSSFTAACLCLCHPEATSCLGNTRIQVQGKIITTGRDIPIEWFVYL